MPTKARYLSQLLALLPKGRIWPSRSGSTLAQVLEAAADGLAKVHVRALQLIEEADPRSTTEMLDDWERNLDLPGDCTAPAVTLQDRRNAVVQKLTLGGGQSIGFYKQIALALGYTITIEEFKPFICGLSRCGDEVGMSAADRNNWEVHVPDPRTTLFRVGESRCGDLLGKIQRAEDLECVLSIMKPAHTRLLVSYEGA